MAVFRRFGESKTKISTAETAKEIIARAKSQFVKRMVREIPSWVKKTFTNGRVAVVKGGAGSDHYIKIDGKTAVWYYFAQNWVFVQFNEMTKEEKRALEQGLTKKDSILERTYGGKVRFHLINDKDFEVFSRIVKDRARKS